MVQILPAGPVGAVRVTFFINASSVYHFVVAGEHYSAMTWKCWPSTARPGGSGRNVEPGVCEKESLDTSYSTNL